MIQIERTTENGYENNVYEINDAIITINTELENNRTIWIDGKPFSGEFITEEDLLKCKKEVSITNKLIGG